MTLTKVREGASSLAVKARKATITLISEGQGSSGFYSAEMLRRDGPTVFPAGTHLVVNHLGEAEMWERNGSHDTRDIVGATTEDARWDDEAKALVAEAEIAAHAAEFVESIKDYIGLSIEAGGVVVDGQVESLAYSPLNAVALVPRAGRGGKIQSLYESFVETGASRGTIISEGTSTNATEQERGTLVSPEDIAKIVEALKPLFTGLQEALAPAAPEVEKTEDTIDVAAVAEAVVAAGLPEVARKRVYEAVSAKADVAEAIAAETAYIESLKESVADATPGLVRESATATPLSHNRAGWVN